MSDSNKQFKDDKHEDEYYMDELENKESRGSNLNAAGPDHIDLNGKLSGYLIFCIAMAVIGGAFQVGWNIGIYNTPFDAIKRFFEVTYEERYGTKMSSGTFDLLWSITNGLLPLGAVFGGLSSGFFSDLLGRKLGIILTNIFVIVCFILNLISKFTKTYETIMVSRFFSGVFCGLFTGIIPLYLNEISPQNYRGLIGTFTQIFIVLGILTTNVYGLPEILGTDDRWPYLVSFLILPVLAHVILFFGVESPKYLYIKKQQEKEAKQVLEKLRGENSEELVKNELNLLKREKDNLAKNKAVGWLDLLKQPLLRHPLFVALGIHIAQQFSGINAVIFYSTKIFSDVGLDGQWPEYATIILGVVQLIMTIICSIIVERAGRKILLLSGMIGMSISSFLLALFRILGQEPGRPVYNYLTIVMAVAYIIFFSIGPGAIPWLITPELFGSNARAKANSIAVLTNWGSAFIVTVTFPFLERAINNYSFILFGGLCAIFSAGIACLLPETKHKSHEQIQDLFASGTIFLFEKKGKTDTF